MIWLCRIFRTYNLARTVYQLSDCIVQVGVCTDVGRIFATELHWFPPKSPPLGRATKNFTSSATPLKPFAFTAASSTAWPPTTLPVNETKSTAGCWTAYDVREGDRCTTWITSSGTPARVNARANRSAARGVWGDGLKIIALPAMIPGRTELTETRYGKLHAS